MAEKKKKRRPLPPPPANTNIFKQMMEQIRLARALWMDSRVPWYTKSIPIITFTYLISPINLVPNLIPIIGQIDDIAILMLGLSMFNSLAPREVVIEHLTRLRLPYKVQKDDQGIIIDMPADASHLEEDEEPEGVQLNHKNRLEQDEEPDDAQLNHDKQQNYDEAEHY